MMRPSRRARRRMAVLLGIGVVGCCSILGLRSLRAAQAARVETTKRTEGLEAYRAGDYARALGDLSYVLGKRRTDIEILLAFADTRSRVPELDGRHLLEAIAAYEQAVRVDPVNVTALARLMELCEHRAVGRLSDAIKRAREILALDPDHTGALGTLARCSFASRDFESALEAVRRIEALLPSETHWYRFHLAVLASMDQGERLIEAQCEEWATAFPDEGRFQYLRGCGLAGMGRFVEARAAAARAAQLGIGTADDLRLLVQLLGQLGLDADCDALLTRAKQEQFPGESWVWAESIRRHVLADDLEGAEKDRAEAMTALGALDAEVLRWIVIADLLRARDEDARASLDAFDATIFGAANPEEASIRRAFSGAIRAYLDREQFAAGEVRARLEEGLALSDDATLCFLLGRVLEEAGETEQAASAFGLASEIERGWILAGTSHVRALLRAGLVEDALGTAAGLMGRWKPGFVPVQLLFAEAWMATARRAGECDTPTDSTGASLSSLIEMLQHYSEQEETRRSAQVWRLLLEAHRLAGDRDSAVSLVKSLLADLASPGDLLLAGAQASVAAGLGFEESLLTRAEEVGHPVLDVAECRAVLLLELNHPQEAVAALDAVKDRIDSADCLRFDLLVAHCQMRAAPLGGVDPLQRLLGTYPDSIEAAWLVLEEHAAWSDASLIGRALETLRREAGQLASVRRNLAEAAALLTFQPGQDQPRARALTLIHAALREAPSSVAALTLMSRALSQGERPDLEQAARHLQDALNVDPSRTDLYPRLVSILQEQGDYRTAAEYLERLGRRRDLDLAMRRTETGLLERQGDFERAIARFGEVVDDRSQETDQLALAALLARTGRHAESRIIIDRVLEQPDHSDEAVVMAAELCALAGRTEEGLALLEANSASDPVAQRVRVGSYHRRTGDFDAAIACFEGAIDQRPRDPELWNQLALTYLHAGDSGRARETVAHGLAIDGAHEGLVVTSALASFDADVSTRQAALRRLREAEGGHPALVATLELLERVGDAAPSARDMAAAAKIAGNHPSFLPAWRIAVNMQMRGGRPERGLELAREAMVRHPAEPGPAEWATQALIRLNRLDEALDATATWRRRSQHDPLRPDLQAAAILLELRRPADAREQVLPHVERLFGNVTRHRDGVALALWALMAGGDADRGMELAWPLVEKDDWWRTTWLRIAAMIEGDPAMRVLERIEPLISNDPAWALRLGATWSQIGATTGNDRCLVRAEELAAVADTDPALHQDATMLRASIAEQRGDGATALDLYREVLRRSPDNAMALNNMAFLLASREGDIDEADGLSRRAVAIAPHVPAYRDTRALVLMNAQRLEEAEFCARSAIESNTTDVGYRLTLAEILTRRSRFHEAAEQINAAEALLRADSIADKRNRARLDESRRRLESARSLSMGG